MDHVSAVLPGYDFGLTNVLSNNRLLYDDKQQVGDLVDYYSARMIATAIRNQKMLLITLPDFKPHRPAFLFAISLIRYYLDSYRAKSEKMQKSPILYFGANIGIREQLSRTSIQGMGYNFAQVFSHQDIRRGENDVSIQTSSESSPLVRLPTVVTIYSPPDPVEILQKASPSLIAIDCGDAKSLAWLNPLLKEVNRMGIPAIAWNQNPLSECVTDFEILGDTFIWPPHDHIIKNTKLSVLLDTTQNVKMQPIILQGTMIDQFSAKLHDIKLLLSQITKEINLKSRLESDAVLVHWRYFRALESLSVPFEFYEAEANKFWGLQSLKKLSNICAHFCDVLNEMRSSICANLEKTGVMLNDAEKLLENDGCALWEICVNFCIVDHAKEESRLLVFPSDSRKRLFLFALLARFNTTEDDLKKMQVYVTCFNEIHRKTKLQNNVSTEGVSIGPAFDLPCSDIVHPIIVGLPSLLITPQIYYTLLFPETDIFLYPHQLSTFINRQSEWSDRIGRNFSHNANTLANISNLEKPIFDPIPEGRIVLMDTIEVDIETVKKTKRIQIDKVWLPNDTALEVDRLFHIDGDIDSEDLVITNNLDSKENMPEIEQIEEICCEEAIKVKFDQGWCAFFNPDDKINIIQDKGLDQRYVRSLKINDKVLMVYGSERQNLYDLIISRVHKHPSIELHLAMIHRWQEELRFAYNRWRLQLGSKNEGLASSRDKEVLLKRMQELGSKLGSTGAIYTWLKGYILCPDEPEDLKRVAEILDIGFVKQYYKIIYQAANRLRGLHRGLSIKLNRWLQDQAVGTLRRDDDDIIDEELGLTFGDIRNSLLILSVLNVETLRGPFLRNNLGRIEKEDQNG